MARIAAFNVAGSIKYTKTALADHFIKSTSALNALRVNCTSGDPSGGTIYLLGLPSS
jgi:hypothetical protein